MKRLKFLLASLLTVSLVVAGFAFTTKATHKPLSTKCFEYDRTQTTNTNDKTASFYSTYLGTVPPGTHCPDPYQVICVICVPNTSTYVDASGNIIINSTVSADIDLAISAGLQVYTDATNGITIYLRVGVL